MLKTVNTTHKDTKIVPIILLKPVFFNDSFFLFDIHCKMIFTEDCLSLHPIGVCCIVSDIYHE